MRVRVIAGLHGGRLINAPSTSRTHPMGERIRNAIFNKLHHELQGARVLDAFAGTGAIGIEAISRGAANVVFVEKDRVAQKVLAENLKSLRLYEPEVKLVRSPVASWINTYDGEKFDVIFADPPYWNPQFSTIERLFGLLKEGGIMVLSHPGKGEVPEGTNEVFVVDDRTYSNAVLTFYRKKG